MLNQYIALTILLVLSISPVMFFSYIAFHYNDWRRHAIVVWAFLSGSASMVLGLVIWLCLIEGIK